MKYASCAQLVKKKKKTRVFTVAERLKLTLMGALNRQVRCIELQTKLPGVEVYRQRVAPSSGLNVYKLLQCGHGSS